MSHLQHTIILGDSGLQTICFWSSSASDELWASVCGRGPTRKSVMSSFHYFYELRWPTSSTHLPHSALQIQDNLARFCYTTTHLQNLETHNDLLFFTKWLDWVAPLTDTALAHSNGCVQLEIWLSWLSVPCLVVGNGCGLGCLSSPSHGG